MKNNSAFVRLERIAKALYGEEWMSALARATNHDRVTFRRWRDGVSSFDQGHAIFGEIDILIERKIEELRELRR
jgi:hypothetical protein